MNNLAAQYEHQERRLIAAGEHPASVSSRRADQILKGLHFKN